ncbi:hypothetical protein RFI_01747, partial [Reticulomyxa filosa]
MGFNFCFLCSVPFSLALADFDLFFSKNLNMEEREKKYPFDLFFKNINYGRTYDMLFSQNLFQILKKKKKGYFIIKFPSNIIKMTHSFSYLDVDLDWSQYVGYDSIDNVGLREVGRHGRGMEDENSGVRGRGEEAEAEAEEEEEENIRANPELITAEGMEMAQLPTAFSDSQC